MGTPSATDGTHRTHEQPVSPGEGQRVVKGRAGAFDVTQKVTGGTRTKDLDD